MFVVTLYLLPNYPDLYKICEKNLQNLSQDANIEEPHVPLHIGFSPTASPISKIFAERRKINTW